MCPKIFICDCKTETDNKIVIWQTFKIINMDGSLWLHVKNVTNYFEENRRYLDVGIIIFQTEFIISCIN